mmetsp:Transcript_17946/g.26135  ORF Transcript_17946/g.26135 Transcript_17946/m.26135 type:complete len:93 (+) Transcript_17946:186-464(+)
MQKVKEIQKKREAQFYNNRFKDAKAREKRAIKTEIEQGIELVRPAASTIRETELLHARERAKEAAKAAGASTRVTRSKKKAVTTVAEDKMET